MNQDKKVKEYHPELPEWKIVYLALIYITTLKSENDISKEYGIPRTTLQRYFTVALKQYDEKLATLVAKKARHMVNDLAAATYRLDTRAKSKLRKSNAVSVFAKLCKNNGKRGCGLRGKTWSALIWG